MGCIWSDTDIDADFDNPLDDVVVGGATNGGQRPASHQRMTKLEEYSNVNIPITTIDVKKQASLDSNRSNASSSESYTSMYSGDMSDVDAPKVI